MKVTNQEITGITSTGNTLSDITVNPHLSNLNQPLFIQTSKSDNLETQTGKEPSNNIGLEPEQQEDQSSEMNEMHAYIVT